VDAQERTGTSFERRKAATRSRIVQAASRLFTERGYSETSMEDIADSADVAVRTIYLHFESKAAILLGFHDDWVDAYVDEICAIPADEPIADVVTTAMRRLVEAGWPDPAFARPKLHPVVEFIGDGAPEIAGHIMHRWVRAQDRIVAAAVAGGQYPADSLVPRARAVTVFATWMAAMLVIRDGHHGAPLPFDASGTALGGKIVQLLAPPPG
jgi:AcrR family transcriptional regulator